MTESLKEKIIGVLMGGFSSERDISLSSGNQVLSALKKSGYTAIAVDPAQDDLLGGHYDIAFNVLHGTFGEDGTVQSLLDLHQIPYTGSGAQASIIAMNKLFTKHVLRENKIPTPEFKVFTSLDQIQHDKPNYPVVLKPINEGSSVGVFIVDNDSDFRTHAETILNTHGPCLMETFIPGKEVTVGVIGHGDNIQVLPILELRPKNKFYDFEAKYTKGLTEFILPAEITDHDTQRCEHFAKQLHQTLGCRGSSRVDMCVHPNKGPFVLEINTIPGLTPTSDLPAQAAHIDMDFERLVECILHSALDRNKSNP